MCHFDSCNKYYIYIYSTYEESKCDVVKYVTE